MQGMGFCVYVYVCVYVHVNGYVYVCVYGGNVTRWFIRDRPALVVPLVRFKGGMNQTVALPRPRSGGSMVAAAGLFLNESGRPFIRFSG